MPKGHWNLGRVVEMYPGADGLVRTVKVRTKDAVYVRPSKSSVFSKMMSNRCDELIFGLLLLLRLSMRLRQVGWEVWANR